MHSTRSSPSPPSPSPPPSPPADLNLKNGDSPSTSSKLDYRPLQKRCMALGLGGKGSAVALNERLLEYERRAATASSSEVAQTGNPTASLPGCSTGGAPAQMDTRAQTTAAVSTTRPLGGRKSLASHASAGSMSSGGTELLALRNMLGDCFKEIKALKDAMSRLEDKNASLELRLNTAGPDAGIAAAANVRRHVEQLSTSLHTELATASASASAAQQQVERLDLRDERRQRELVNTRTVLEGVPVKGTAYNDASNVIETILRTAGFDPDFHLSGAFRRSPSTGDC
ncbi:hypothetical protein JCM6882_002228 [Rhodosporidiobolus microsporus]